MTIETEPPNRYVRAADWARIASLLSLPPAAVPADVIASLEARSGGYRGQADRDERAAALRDCRQCDEFGWLLDCDGLPAEPARKCSHGRRIPTSESRSFHEPLHPHDDRNETLR